MLRRLPLRLRVTAAFAGVTAIVLAAIGIFLYVRLGSELDGTLDAGLRARVGDIRVLARQLPPRTSPARGSLLVAKGEHLAQILDPSGRVLDATPEVATAQLTAPELARARRRRTLIERGRLPAIGEPARLLAAPITVRGRRLVVVVGTSLKARRDAQQDLGALLLIGGPIALALASAAGYGVAAAALAPIESMRRRAAAIQASAPGRRLPVPPTDDELSRLGTTLNTMLDRLEAAYARERTFVSDASHELRTPLAIMKTELEVALLRRRSTAELERTIRLAARQTDRLAQLAEDLLVIARSDQGQLPIRRAEVPTTELLEGVRTRYERRAGEAGATIDVSSPSGLRLEADPARIEQAVGNLLDNALRHGGRHVELAAQATPEGVDLHVLDDGEGFPPAFIGSAFERFTQADEARTTGGAGLGLAIVELIARAHGGRASAANRPGGGADVWLTVPQALMAPSRSDGDFGS
jgi:two-component system, OmpR family, sensor kinase